MISLVRQAATVLLVAVASAAGAAADLQHFPDERTQAASCAGSTGSQERVQSRPDLIAACEAQGKAGPLAVRTTSPPPPMTTRRDPLPARLPTTAGLLSWVAILGSFSVLGALALTLSRND